MLIILTGTLQISNIDAQIISTIAGIGPWGYNGDGIPATAAKLNDVPRIAIDACGNLYLGDSRNNRVRKVDAVTGIITTVAGTGVLGYNGDGIPATSAQLNWPTCIALDNVGNVYIGENEYRIRKVDVVTGIISTFAGNGIAGFSGDGVLADTSSIYTGDMAFDPFGNMYMCDLFRIRKIDPSGIITTIAGTGDSGIIVEGVPATATDIGTYPAIATDIHGDVFFVDAEGSIRKITVSTGAMVRVAGIGTVGPYTGDGIPATSCQMAPTSVYVDKYGNIFVAIFSNNICIEIDTFGITHTVVGTGVQGFSGDGGPATAARLWWPKDIIFDNRGQMYLSDWENGRIRKVTFPYTAPTITNSISANPGDTICTSRATTFTDMITGGTSGAIYGYEWYVDGSIVSTTGNTYTYSPANGDSIRCVCISDLCNGGDSASSNSIIMSVSPISAPTITVTAPAASAVGSTVTVNATIAGAGSGYSINWYNNSALFSTTAALSTTYTKAAGTDHITATVVPGETGCYDSTASAVSTVMASTTGAPSRPSPEGKEVLRSYPNPLKDLLYLDDVRTLAEYKIMSMIGSAIRQGTLQQGSNTINVKELPGGVYMLEVVYGDGSRVTAKIVKQ